MNRKYSSHEFSGPLDASKKKLIPNVDQDQQVPIQTLQKAYYKIKNIVREMGVNNRHVKHVRLGGTLAETQSPGRSSVLSEIQVHKLENFVCNTQNGLFKSLLKPALHQFTRQNLHGKAIQNYLFRRGHKCRFYWRKLPLSVENKTKRLSFVQTP